MPEQPGILHRLRLMTWRDRGVLLEALVMVTAASAMTALLPFRMIARLASRSPGRVSTSAQPHDDVCARVRWAVIGIARRAPFRAVCLQQALASQFMLRRRGLPAVLYFGVMRDAGGDLKAHAWVRVDDIDVVGGDEAPRFALIAAFPKA